MRKAKPKRDRELTIRDLYPDLDGAQLQEAEANLGLYLGVVLQIYERVRSDPKAYAQLQRLTRLENDGAMDAERSNNKQHPISQT